MIFDYAAAFVPLSDPLPLCECLCAFFLSYEKCLGLRSVLNSADLFSMHVHHEY